MDSLGKPLAGADVWLSSGLAPGGEQPMIGGVLWMQSGRGSFPRNAKRRSLMTRTDKDGQFRLELPDEIVRNQEPLPVGLWAFVAGERIAWRRLAWAIPAPSEPVRLVVAKASAASFRVLGPDGAADAGARVLPCALEPMVVPIELAEKIAAVAGADGVADLPAFASGELRFFRVESSKYGSQIVHTSAPNATAVQLEPVGRLKGRVIAEAGKPVVGLRIRAETLPDAIRSRWHSRASRTGDRCRRAVRDTGRRGRTTRARPRLEGPARPSLPRIAACQPGCRGRADHRRANSSQACGSRRRHDPREGHRLADRRGSAPKSPTWLTASAVMLRW